MLFIDFITEQEQLIMLRIYIMEHFPTTNQYKNKTQ